MPHRSLSGPFIHVSVTGNSGPRGNAVHAHLTLPVTRERMELLKQLAGSARWEQQMPTETVGWAEVEAIVAGHVPPQGS
jgi:hypothetical protein